MSATPPPAKRQRLIPRAGWFKLFRADTARIRECGENDGRVSVAVLMAVWVALVDVANEERGCTFTKGVGIIRSRAGVSRRHTFTALASLVAIGMVSKETHRAQQAGKFFDENTWTLHPSNLTPLGAKAALGNHCTSASKRANRLHKGTKKLLTEAKEEKKEESAPLSPLPLEAAGEGPTSKLPSFCAWS